MKKIVLTFLLLTSTIAFAGPSEQIFTRYEANRIVSFLSNNPEIMFYCPPDYVANYVYTTDVWMECIGINRYEVWIYGVDVVSNEIVSTPIDLSYVCVNNNGYPVSVGRVLGFACSTGVINFVWRMPVYRPIPRGPHPHNFYQNYFHQPNVRPYHAQHRRPPQSEARLHNYGPRNHSMYQQAPQRSGKNTPARNVNRSPQQGGSNMDRQTPQRNTKTARNNPQQHQNVNKSNNRPSSNGGNNGGKNTKSSPRQDRGTASHSNSRPSSGGGHGGRR